MIFLFSSLTCSDAPPSHKTESGAGLKKTPAQSRNVNHRDLKSVPEHWELNVAIDENNLKKAGLLIKNGVNVNVRNNFDTTPLCKAKYEDERRKPYRKKNTKAIIELLKKNGGIYGRYC